MRDEWFIRGKVPMTKSEVRTVSLSKLELYEDCEFWDIGAGTGSVSVEAAVSCPGIHVCAFEYKEEAVEPRYPDCDQPDCAGVSDSAYELPERARDRGGDSVHADCKSGEDWFQSFDERAESDLYHITGRK